ncbi:hypothetical protein OIU34_17200 [Pararhizobium sp. BT-229]|uniref:hypothetical protein n=1 Tax=Pararhizobium sp. BT-229 TaxID=2986923 RepID=UPI0021F78577|nr:hypothetical protein [Pararhizobium sp. BT-229]MCV9963639.1 hypothetical protein [Pararhizobium sp. BT-229]
METKVKLTPPQKEFLEDYFEDILHGRADLLDKADADVIDILRGMDFDDGAATTTHRVRIARNLREMGLLEEFDPHETKLGTHIYLSFSRKGAEVMFDLLKDAAAVGRLPAPRATTAVTGIRP